MNLLDIILGIILVFAFVQGMRKGLFVSLASFIGLILGVIGAIYFSEFAVKHINNWLSLNEETTSFVAKAVTFIAIIFIINWAAKFLTKIADFAFLGLVNKILGGVFNLLFSAFLISIFFMFFNQWNATEYVISNEKKENSNLYAPVEALAPFVLSYLGKDLKNINIQKELLNIEKFEKKNNL